MKTVLHKLIEFVTPAIQGKARPHSGPIDSLLQTFENCRPGLSDETIQGDKEGANHYFLELYEKEQPRFINMINVQEGFLSSGARQKLFTEVDALVRKVVIPAYVRLATSFTPRERNNFYLLPARFYFIERFGWALAGMILGSFIVWAPFIPLWSKEWILPFTILGLIFPDLRKFLSIKRYEAELNKTVAKASDEIERIELEYASEEMLTRQQTEQPTVEQAVYPTEERRTVSEKHLEGIKPKGGN